MISTPYLTIKPKKVLGFYNSIFSSKHLVKNIYLL
jgi:hypothetical protein